MSLNKALSATFIFVLTGVFAALYLIFYCDLFYIFGKMSKERVLISPTYVLLTTPLLFWVSAFLCRKFSNFANGSNLQNLETGAKNLDNEKAEKVFGVKTIFICTLSSLVSTFGCGSLGREGPSVQISAGIFYVAGSKIKKICEKINLENWIYAGAGLGFAVAFHAPLAGLVCALEKSIKSNSSAKIPNVFLAASAIFIYAAFFFDGKPLFTSEQVSFGVNKNTAISICFIALVCGLISILFRSISLFFYQKIVAIKSNFWHLIPILAGVIVASISMKYGVYAIGGGIKTVNDFLANTNNFSTYGEVFGRIFTTILTFISGSAGGIVAPSVAIGGGIGSLAGDFLNPIDPKLFIMIGMVGFLSSTISLPVTAAIVIFESSAQSIMSIPFFIAISIIAHKTSALFAVTDSKTLSRNQ
jgi:H+/Cl- antiporter ClcA